MTETDRGARDWARLQARAREQARADRAKARTLRGLFWSLVACLVVVGFLALVTWRPGEKEEVRAVDYRGQLAQARDKAQFRVLAPDPMPEGWQATSVEVKAPDRGPAAWHLGVLTDTGKYVGLEQSDADRGDFLADELGRFADDGTATVGGVTWERKRLLDRGDHALVLAGSGVTTVVTGSAGYPVLEAFAAVLR